MTRAQIRQHLSSREQQQTDSGSPESVEWSGRCCVREQPDYVANPKPDYLAGGVASCPELIGMTGGFLPGSVAIALEHQVRDTPIVDLGYHAAKVKGCSPVNG